MDKIEKSDFIGDLIEMAGEQISEDESVAVIMDARPFYYQFTNGVKDLEKKIKSKKDLEKAKNKLKGEIKSKYYMHLLAKA